MLKKMLQVFAFFLNAFSIQNLLEHVLKIPVKMQQAYLNQFNFCIVFIVSFFILISKNTHIFTLILCRDFIFECLFCSIINRILFIITKELFHCLTNNFQCFFIFKMLCIMIKHCRGFMST